MLGGEKKSMREGVIAGLDSELEMAVFETDPDVMFGSVPGAEVDVELVSERIDSIRIRAVRAKPDCGQIETAFGDEFNGERPLESGRFLNRHDELSRKSIVWSRTDSESNGPVDNRVQDMTAGPFLRRASNAAAQAAEYLSHLARDRSISRPSPKLSRIMVMSSMPRMRQARPSVTSQQ